MPDPLSPRDATRVLAHTARIPTALAYDGTSWHLVPLCEHLTGEVAACDAEADVARRYDLAPAPAPAPAAAAERRPTGARRRPPRRPTLRAVS